MDDLLLSPQRQRIGRMGKTIFLDLRGPVQALPGLEWVYFSALLSRLVPRGSLPRMPSTGKHVKDGAHGFGGGPDVY